MKYLYYKQVIESKEAEQKLLESQLRDTRQEKDKKQEEVLRAREDVLSNFAELMETELQCSICNELFVKVGSRNQNAEDVILSKHIFIFHKKKENEKKNKAVEV